MLSHKIWENKVNRGAVVCPLAHLPRFLLHLDETDRINVLEHDGEGWRLDNEVIEVSPANASHILRLWHTDDRPFLKLVPKPLNCPAVIRVVDLGTGYIGQKGPNLRERCCPCGLMARSTPACRWFSLNELPKLCAVAWNDKMTFYATIVYHNTPMKRQMIYVIEDSTFIEQLNMELCTIGDYVRKDVFPLINIS